MDAFAEAMYQWAATLTYQGTNLPFSLPLKVDRLPTGFQVRRSGGRAGLGVVGGRLEHARPLPGPLSVHMLADCAAVTG